MLNINHASIKIFKAELQINSNPKFVFKMLTQNRYSTTDITGNVEMYTKKW